MTTIKRILFSYLLPLLLLGGSGYLFFLLGEEQEKKATQPPRSPGTLVQVMEPVEYTGGIQIDTSGVAVPHRELQMSSQVAGRIVYKAPQLQQGRFVEKDTILLKVDPQDYEIAVERLRKQQEQSAAQLDALQVELANTERLIDVSKESLALSQRELARVQGLLARGAGAESAVDEIRRTELLSRESLIRLENEKRSVMSQEISLKLTRELNQVQLKQALLDLDRTVLRAPFAGVVVDVSVEQDAMVASGTPVAMLEDTSAVEVLCHLRPEDADVVLSQSPGARAANAGTETTAYDLPRLPATVTYRRAGRTFTWQAVLDRQEGLGLDEKTRTLPCRLLVSDPLKCDVVPSSSDNQCLALIRGMFVSLRLHAQPSGPLLAIPETAIRPGKRLWVAQDGFLRVRPVQIVRLQNGVALIDPESGGLRPGEKVIVSPIPNIRDGIPIVVKPAESGLLTAPPAKGGRSAEPAGTPQTATDHTTDRPLSDRLRLLLPLTSQIQNPRSCPWERTT